ncbi:arginine-ornithine antiporter [Bacillus massilinigeriensis]|uniref:arginine-ornithine antiporter n=1 Tax=Bacillus mediterraneensis TaxID=1805474 RepID=UPI0008F8A81F|nr:arginine-ornithine antiporter [Bacillus mediterraneensis]
MSEEKKLGLFSLIAIVVGSMIGGGAFNLATDMAGGASAGAIVLGWVITGVGIIALGLSFQNLTDKRPDLEGGIFSYATAGFGRFMGFNSAWGYWFSAWLGNVAYATLLFSSIGYFFPTFKGGQNVASIIGASILLWLVHALILRGVQSAALVNLITTIAKLVPVFLFIIVGIFAFNFDTFTYDFWGTGGGFEFSDVMSQVKSTMLVTLWVFIGVEGAVVLSSRAKDKKDVGKATIIGLLGTLVIYIIISLMSIGMMSRPEVAQLDNPSMAYVFESVVGKWGATFINLGLIISVLGAWLGWTLLASEIPFLAGKSGLFPKWFAKENKNGAPINSLWISNGLIQVFLLSFLVTDQAYNFAFSLASSAILIPYAFSAFYQFKHSLQSSFADRTKNLTVGIIASVYGIWMIYAAGVDYLLLTMLLYAPGILVYSSIQKEAKAKTVFTRPELIIAVAFVALAILAIVQLAMGEINI